MFDISPNSSGNRFRRNRVGLLNGLIRSVVAEKGACSVLDIGGTAIFWRTWSEMIDWNTVQITCLNLPGGDPVPDDGLVHRISGDARAMTAVADSAFDICFSNSVIEHVGAWQDMEAMAAEVRRVAPRYMVQTPNFWFPIEPHARTPALHWLPEPLAYRLVMARRCGFWARQRTVASAVRTVQSARLIDARQLGALFPDARIDRERFCGLTKSLIAIRG